MKERVSATIDLSTSKTLRNLLSKGKYRNQSHIIEEAIRLLVEKEKHEKH